MREAWMTGALCATTNPEAFFPEKGGSTRDAKKICDTCVVAAQCLEYALRKDIRIGVWGNKSPEQRARMQGKKRAA